MKKTIFIAGGGTGGHIYPGIAIARALLKIQPDLEIRFVGTQSGLETKIIPKEGFPLEIIQGGKLNMSGRMFDKLMTLLKLPIGLLQSLFLIIKHRPLFVLGVGGYASGPFVLMASLLARPTAIWEPNAHPGMANRWLSQFVNCCYIVFEETQKNLKNKNVIKFGMPVRAEIEQSQKQKNQDGKFHLLSFGGSQGSRAISTVLSDAILSKGEWTQGLSVVHQTGSIDYQKLKEKYQNNPSVDLHEFIYDMPKYYAWADLVVARGGASTIMELAAFGVVPIIIPLPAADDHQQKNAESLVRADAGVMILQKDLNQQTLINEIQKLRSNPDRLKQMSENLKKLFQPQASMRIAEDILKRVGNS